MGNRKEKGNRKCTKEYENVSIVVIPNSLYNILESWFAFGKMQVALACSDPYSLLMKSKTLAVQPCNSLCLSIPEGGSFWIQTVWPHSHLRREKRPSISSSKESSSPSQNSIQYSYSPHWMDTVRPKDRPWRNTFSLWLRSTGRGQDEHYLTIISLLLFLSSSSSGGQNLCLTGGRNQYDQRWICRLWMEPAYSIFHGVF